MATIREVAQEAGVAISTVSKAMNGSYTISEEQTKNIRKIAARMGYTPNARAQTFARQATRSAVFLTCLDRNAAFENPHMFEIISGAQSALRQKGYALILQHCDYKDICATVRDIMDSKRADGLLIHASVVTHELSLLLSRSEIPHIVIGKPEAGQRLCWIDNNNRLSGEIAARHLYELGHRNVAFIGGHESDRISEDRLIGVKSELPHTTILRGDSTIEEGKRITAELLRLPKRPQALVCANNHLAYGCLTALQEAKLHVLADISLITFDDYPFALYMRPALTTVSIDVYEMGIQAGKLLRSCIKKPEMQIQSFTTVPVLVKRASTAAPN
ncbi:MAG: LacI family transcriptional regulator [Clostridiales bacterium]|nr:LacI family transcriptional regulator [Clostridiales bacterium]